MDAYVGVTNTVAEKSALNTAYTHETAASGGWSGSTVVAPEQTRTHFIIDDALCSCPHNRLSGVGLIA